MKTMKFELKISFAYLIIGCLWILFSDKVLYLFIQSEPLRQELQTYKGWFYVLATGLLFYFFLRKHLMKLHEVESELKNHKENLQLLVNEKTKDLNLVNNKLEKTNQELNVTNIELSTTLKNLKDTQLRLLQADKMASLGVLTAGIAHEINNPLNFIVGAKAALVEYFKRNGSEDLKKTKMLLSSMDEGVERIIGIVSSLNAFSRDSKNYNELCDINKIVGACLRMFQNKTKGRITIQGEYCKENVTVIGNAGKLHQVFVNLLSNAIQSINEEGRLEITTKKNEKSVEIKISDTGCGIPEENLKMIADPFFTTKPPGEGTGLGLSIAYTIVHDHKGTMNFESEVGKGTTVHLSFPLSSDI